MSLSRIVPGFGFACASDAIGALSDVAPLHRVGRHRIPATSGNDRSKRLPEVPTFREQGPPEIHATGRHGRFALSGTPEQDIERLSAAVSAVLTGHDLRAKRAGLGLEPTGTTFKALTGIMAADAACWRPSIERAGFGSPWRGTVPAAT